MSRQEEVECEVSIVWWAGNTVRYVGEEDKGSAVFLLWFVSVFLARIGELCVEDLECVSDSKQRRSKVSSEVRGWLAGWLD